MKIKIFKTPPPIRMRGQGNKCNKSEDSMTTTERI